MSKPNLTFSKLHSQYAQHMLTPSALAQTLYERANQFGQKNIWIEREAIPQLMEQTGPLDKELEKGTWKRLPLFGIPFAVKDNIDVAGRPTTAACPQFKYVAEQSCPVVDTMQKLGAIYMGKTNLDQFATGLVGTRSPYGVCHNALEDRYISGGSSSGSAVAVALGLASVALGTDTAGSGRVPAGFNDIVGLKPSRDTLSTQGVVPACKSLDCVSIFALCIEDATTVWEQCRDGGAPIPSIPFPPTFRFALPQTDQLEFFGNSDYAHLFDQAVERLQQCGGTLDRIDYRPFQECAQLLYNGPWVSERLLATEDLIRNQPDALLPVIRQIIEQGFQYSALDMVRGQTRLEELTKEIAPLWKDTDCMVVPTTGTIYTIEEVEADPITLNSNLGYYTNFLNLFNLCAISIPAGFTPDRLPMGITLIAPAHHEFHLTHIAQQFERIR